MIFRRYTRRKDTVRELVMFTVSVGLLTATIGCGYQEKQAAQAAQVKAQQAELERQRREIERLKQQQQY